MTEPRSECEPVLPLLAALHDGELEGDLAAQVRAHLAGCPDCRARLEDQGRVASLLATRAPVPGLDARRVADLDAALALELARTRPVPASPRLALLRRLATGPLVGAAAAVLLVALLWEGLASSPARAVLAATRRRLPDLPHRDPAFRRVAAPPSPGPQELEGLTPSQRAALERDGLVQVPATDARPTDFLVSRPGKVRPLVTVDAALFLWNATVARAAVEVERARVEPLLRVLLEAIGRELETMAGEPASPEVAAALDRARGLVGVAADLDAVPMHVEGNLREAVRDDAAAVRRGSGRAVSRTLGAELDLDDLRPRGPLATSPEHFRAIAWLSRASLSLEGPGPDPRAAALLVLGLARANAQGRPALALWDDLDATVELLHGPQQDEGAFDVLAALGRAFGTTAGAREVASPEGIRRFADEARRGHATRAWALGLDPKAPARFTLLGGTRTLEGVCLEALSAPRLPGRKRPGSLDLLAALGSRAARTIGSFERVPGWDAGLDALAPRFESVRDPSRAVTFAGSGVERARLFALAALVDADGDASESHESHRLLAALAALDGTEPALLDAPEPTIDPRAPLPLVEPAPALYERLAHGARRLAQGLEVGAERGSTVSKSCAHLRRVAALLSGLARASVEALEDRAPSPRAGSALAAFYPTLAMLAPERATSVEDLHVLVLPSGEREILERASGPFDRIFEIVRIPGGEPGSRGASPAVLAVGPALSAREVAVRDARLAPGSLEQAPRLPDPSWATHLVR